MVLPQGNRPFRFHLTSPWRDATGQELWDATVKPDGIEESIPVTFRLALEPPARSASRGTAIRASIQRGDRGGMEFFWIMLKETFKPLTRGGGLMATAVGPADSVPLTLIVEKRGTRAPWVALAQLENGGQFQVVIDGAARRGEFRSVGAQYDSQVFFALIGLSTPSR